MCKCYIGRTGQIHRTRPLRSASVENDEERQDESSNPYCVGCDIVQADHAPEAGVAQGIFHGILVRHQGKHQEEVEEGLKEEVERRVKREHSSNQTQVRMHG